MSKSLDLFDNPYLLLTPGPLSTSRSVRAAMLRDWCTWDDDYNHGIVQPIRRRLLEIGLSDPRDQSAYTAVLLQGSGSFAVESCLGSVMPPAGKLLILTNGAYGRRMAEMARILRIRHTVIAWPETECPDVDRVEAELCADPDLTHLAFVHCETTTGILNPLPALAALSRVYHKSLIVDAMSSFGGIPIDLAELGIDYLISSANKCIQGVPGFAFVLARKEALSSCHGLARSLVLDLYDQWQQMDQTGQWRYTSPTHVVRAFAQALAELQQEGGVNARQGRYSANQRLLVSGMRALGFQTLLPDALQSPIITAFLYPEASFDFATFYQAVKTRGFVLYPGKVSQAETFRIGTIGHVFADDVRRLIQVLGDIRQGGIYETASAL